MRPKRRTTSGVGQKNLVALKGGVPSGANRLGIRGWSWGWLFVGVLTSLLVHTFIWGFFMAIPWEYLNARPTLSTVEAATLAFACLVIAALGLYAVLASRGWRSPYSGLAMLSGVMNFTAMLIAGFLSYEIAVTGRWYDIEHFGDPFAISLICFGLALMSGIAAVVSLLRSRSRGWVLAIWGLVMPLWFGGQLWHRTVFPIYVRMPNEVERSLPLVGSAYPFEPQPHEVRPRVRLLADGTILEARTSVLLFDPEEPDNLDALRDYLRKHVRFMAKRPLDEQTGEGPMIPDGPLLVLADSEVDFDKVLALFRVCSEPDIRVWKIELGVRRDSPPWLGVVLLYLPRSFQEPTHTPPERHLVIDTSNPDVVRYSLGKHETTDPKELGEFEFDDFGDAVTWSHVADVLDAIQGEGTPSGPLRFRAFPGGN